MKFQTLATLAAVLALGSLGAQAQTSIHADIAPGFGLSTTVTAKGSVYTINNGTLVGSNLFESFSAFSLAAGDTARWTYTPGNPANVANVISRVTGGAPSQISGTLDSRPLPNANFYFINPAGVVFGAGVALKVPGATHFSTASQLILSDGSVFAAATPSGSTLTMAAPSAFGFLGGEGDIAVDSAGPGFAQPAPYLSLIAADVSVTNSTILVGHLDLIAAGHGALNISVTDLMAAAPFAGSLIIGATSLSSHSPAGADAVLNLGGGAVSFANGSLLQTLTSDTVTDGGAIALNAQSLSVDDSSVMTTTTGAGAAGSMAFKVAGGVTMGSDASIYSLTRLQGTGGNIDLAAQSLSINESQIVSLAINNNQARSTGNTGSINISLLDDLDMQQGSAISSSPLNGNAGPVTIRASSLSLNASNIIAEPQISGASGVVDVEVAGAISLVNGSSLHSIPRGAGGGGTITLNAGSLLLDNSDLSATSFGSGTAGALNIDVQGAVTMRNQASIISKANADGPGGVVALRAESRSMDASGFNTSTYGSADGQPLTFNIADDVVMTNGSFMHSLTQGTGKAGAINLNSQTLLMDDSNLNATSFSTGAAGAINIDVIGEFSMRNSAYIDLKANTQGAGGAITLTASALKLAGGSGLDTSTYGSANAGSLTIKVTTDVDLSDSAFIRLFSVGNDSGQAGNLSIASALLNMKSNAQIRTGSESANSTGSISIQTGALVIDGGHTFIDSSDRSVVGALGGNVDVEAERIILSNGGAITTNSRAGKAGGITLDFPTGGLLVLQGIQAPGTIKTNSAAGFAGEISINSASAIVLNGGIIEAVGPFRGAHVKFNTPAVVESSDRVNAVDVAGNFTLDGEFANIAQSVTVNDLAFVDAGQVLRGQCAAQSASGAASRLVTRLNGPYRLERTRLTIAGLDGSEPAGAGCGSARAQ